ncbi:MAG: potassium transporter TrkG [Pseudomonadota bacterium]|nr:potassium transporter TrkG [Pseudomonadota bacterium]
MRVLASLSISALIVCFYLSSWLVPIGMGVAHGDLESAKMFLFIGVPSLIVFLLLYRCFKNHTLQKKDGFLVVGISWLLISFLSALPFYFAALDVPFQAIDVWLESVSALTTTGIEFVGGIASWPITMLWYRQQLEWVGGVGVVIMMISLLTLHEGTVLSIYHGEFGRDVRDVRVTPRLSSTAKDVCYIYGGLWAGCTACFYFLGVPVLYAMMEAMATVSTGGFSLDTIVPIYNQSYCQWVAIVFMILGAIGFHTHFQVLKNKSPSAYIQQTEPRLLLVIISIVSVFVLLSTWQEAGFQDISMVVFEVAAFATTTGFETEIQSVYPHVVLVFALMGILGACCGSTAGGVKLVRVHVLFQEARMLLMRLIYPNIMNTPSVNGVALSDPYIASVRGYVSLFLLTFFVSVLTLLSLGVKLDQSFYLICATITNVGGAVGGLEVDQLTYIQKFVLSIVMILGRLEIAALLVLLMPRYWRSN